MSTHQEIISKHLATPVSHDDDRVSIFIRKSTIPNIEHGLKTPLNAIQCLLELLVINRQNNLTRTQVDQLTVIYESGRQLSERIEDILQMFRLKQGKVNLDLEQLDTGKLIEQLEQQFRQENQKNIKLVLRVDQNLPKVTTDPQKLMTILKHLLANAIIPTRVGVITISLLTSTDAQYPLAIQISDTGDGIGPEYLNDIFEAFYQIDNSVTRSHSGFGLGLTIAKDLSLRLNGKLDVSSQEGVGSTFTVSLPLSVDSVSAM